MYVLVPVSVKFLILTADLQVFKHNPFPPQVANILRIIAVENLLNKILQALRVIIILFLAGRARYAVGRSSPTCSTALKLRKWS